MKKTINNLSAILFIIFLITFSFYQNKKNNKIEKMIKQNGLFTIALVKNKDAAAGSVRTIDYDFKFKGLNFKGHSFVKKEFYSKISINDTIIIKFLKSNPSKSFVLQNKYFKNCIINNRLIWKNIQFCK